MDDIQAAIDLLAKALPAIAPDFDLRFVDLEEDE